MDLYSIDYTADIYIHSCDLHFNKLKTYKRKNISKMSAQILALFKMFVKNKHFLSYILVFK